MRRGRQAPLSAEWNGTSGNHWSLIFATVFLIELLDELDGEVHSRWTKVKNEKEGHRLEGRKEAWTTWDRQRVNRNVSPSELARWTGSLEYPMQQHEIEMSEIICYPVNPMFPWQVVVFLLVKGHDLLFW